MLHVHFLYIFHTSLFKINDWICRTRMWVFVGPTYPMIDLEKRCMRERCTRDVKKIIFHIFFFFKYGITVRAPIGTFWGFQHVLLVYCV
jgi:hypothetical protein